MEAHGTPAAGTLKGRTANSLLKMGTPQIVSHPAAAAPFAFLARLSRATCTRDRGGRLRHSLPQPLHAEPAGDVTGQTWTGAPSFTPPSVHSGGLRSSHIYTCSLRDMAGTPNSVCGCHVAGRRRARRASVRTRAGGRRVFSQGRGFLRGRKHGKHRGWGSSGGCARG